MICSLSLSVSNGANPVSIKRYLSSSRAKTMFLPFSISPYCSQAANRWCSINTHKKTESACDLKSQWSQELNIGMRERQTIRGRKNNTENGTYIAIPPKVNLNLIFPSYHVVWAIQNQSPALLHMLWPFHPQYTMYLVAKIKIKVNTALLWACDPQEGRRQYFQQTTEPSKYEVHRFFAKRLFVSRKFQPNEKPDG